MLPEHLRHPAGRRLFVSFVYFVVETADCVCSEFPLDTAHKFAHSLAMSVLLTKPSSDRPRALRPLQNGDHLTGAEFLRRYEAMPHLKKAELIEGIVYMGSPVRYHSHGMPDGLVQTWLGTYSVHTPGIEFVSNTTAQLDIDNVPQPDALLRISEECGGQSSVDAQDYLAGAPELVVEVAASSASIDTREKQRAYRRNGVREYLIWLVEEREIRCQRLFEGEYQIIPLDKSGVFKSDVFPGLWLDTKAALALDAAAVLRTLNTGLRSRVHRDFVARLAANRSARRKKS